MATPIAVPNAHADKASIPLAGSPPSLNEKIGFVGLGNMGYVMARNIASLGRANFPNLPAITVWNRSANKAEQLVDEVGRQNARAAKELEEVANECDIIITSLASDDVVRDVYQHLANTLASKPPSKDKIFVEMSTTFPTVIAELDKLLSKIQNVHFISCPVLGLPAIAAKSQLYLLMSGHGPSKRVVSELLVPAVGRKVMDLGEEAEKAPTFKLIANSMVVGSIEVMAEAFTFAQKAGIDGSNVLNLIKDYFPAPTMMAHADKMLHENFDGDVGFNVGGGIEVTTHIRQLTANKGCPMPIIDVAHQHLLTARGIHQTMKQEGSTPYERLDWSGIIAGSRVAAGLPAFNHPKEGHPEYLKVIEVSGNLKIQNFITPILGILRSRAKL